LDIGEPKDGCGITVSSGMTFLRGMAETVQLKNELTTDGHR
jgi:hypothetical protein